MEVVPTGDADDDDGVVWYRCPQCQGFLPKLKGADDQVEAEVPTAEVEQGQAESQDESLPWDSPAAMMKDLADSDSPAAGALDESDDDDVMVGFLPASESETPSEPQSPASVESLGSDLDLMNTPTVDIDDDVAKTEDEGEPDDDVEPILEYAAMLADSDIGEAVPYRPWGDYEVGQCVNHLAWNDCGVVVAKENLPGGRKIIKCYFEGAGVVRLIEQAPK